MLYSCEEDPTEITTETPVTFANDEFERVAIAAGVDLDGDNVISESEATMFADTLDFSDNTVIVDMSDLVYFTSLTALNCNGASSIEELDLRTNVSLTYLYCTSCPDLSTLYLATGQTITTLSYNNTVTTIEYK